jgi:hypothetical protein
MIRATCVYVVGPQRLAASFFMYAVWSKSWTYKYIRLVWGASLYISLSARGRGTIPGPARGGRGGGSWLLGGSLDSTSLAQCGSSSVEATTSRALEKSTQCAKKKDTSKRAEGRLCRARSPRADTRTRITRSASGDRGGPPLTHRARAPCARTRERRHTLRRTHTPRRRESADSGETRGLRRAAF